MQVPSLGLVADPGPSGCSGPRHRMGRLPSPTQAQEVDTRGAEEEGQRPTGSDLAEAWSSTSKAARTAAELSAQLHPPQSC